jgi:hypothetical protein
VLARLNDQLHEDGHRSISFGALASQQRADEVDPEMRLVLSEVHRLLV